MIGVACEIPSSAAAKLELVNFVFDCYMAAAVALLTNRFRDSQTSTTIVSVTDKLVAELFEA